VQLHNNCEFVVALAEMSDLDFGWSDERVIACFLFNFSFAVSWYRLLRNFLCFVQSPSPAPVMPTKPPTLPPTPAPTVSSPVGSESEQITSVCELDGGSFASCDPLPDLPSLEVCIDLDASLDECNFWLRNATTGEDFCCRGCDVCPPGCTSTFSFDCGNILDNTTFPCDCPPTPSPPSETVSAVTPSVVPTARPTSLPTSAFVPAPSSAGLESICMIDGGRDAFCSPSEGTTLATCFDYNSLSTECSMWIRELDLSVDICCEECSVCPPGCDNPLAFACENVAEGASLDCGFCP